MIKIQSLTSHIVSGKTDTKDLLCSGQEENKSLCCSSSVYRGPVKETPVRELNTVQRTEKKQHFGFKAQFKVFCINNFMTNTPVNQYVLIVKLKCKP